MKINLKNIKQMLFSGDEKNFKLAKNILIQNKDTFDADEFWDNVSNYPKFGYNASIIIDLTKELIFNLKFDCGNIFSDIFIKESQDNGLDITIKYIFELEEDYLQ